MSPIVRLRIVARLFGLFVLIGVYASAASAQTTALTTISQSGDYAGGGVNRSLTVANASFAVSTSYNNGISVRITLAGMSYPDYWLDFRPANGETLQVGTYPYALGYSYLLAPELNVEAPNYCGDSVGRFVIRELVIAPGGAVTRFAADFEQHCYDNAPGLFGSIRFQSTIQTTDPFDGAYPALRLGISTAHGTVTGGGLNCGTGGSTCTITPASATQVSLLATPDPGYMFAGWSGACSGGTATTVHVNMIKQCSAIFSPLIPVAPQTLLTIDSAPGNWVGRGRVLALSAGSQWRFSTYSNSNTVDFEVDSIAGTDESYWHFNFVAPTGKSIGSGIYQNAKRSATATNPGIDISSDGAGCGQTFGNFTIMDLRRSANGSIASLAIDFEFNCEQITAPPGITGSIRYNSAIPPSTFLSLSPVGNGRIVSAPAGFSCGLGNTVCSSQITVGTMIQLIPQAAPGWTFSGWSGSTACSSSPTAITSRMNCVATFTTCTIGVSPSGGSVPAAGATTTFTVTTTPNCSWDAASTTPWLSVVGGAGVGSGTFSVVASSKRAPGNRSAQILVSNTTAVPIDQTGGTGAPIDSLKWNLDPDSKTDIAVWRANTGTWYTRSSNQPGMWSSHQWGAGYAPYDDVPVPGDYDGDQKSDFAVWRPDSGMWYVQQSTTGYNQVFSLQWGSRANGDVPVPADYDGDGKIDPAVWRTTTGVWYITSSANNYAPAYAVQWGAASLTDRPMVGDYDGDGKADIAVWRSSTGTWYVLPSHMSYAYAYAYVRQWGLGALGDTPVAGDYDGDGVTDIGVWRSGNGYWFLLPSSANFSPEAAWTYQYGLGSAGDVPVSGDFDGDGKSDLAVWRAPTGYWYFRQSSTNFTDSNAVQWGGDWLSDRPVPR